MRIIRIFAILILFSFRLSAQDENNDSVIKERIQCIQGMLEQDQKSTTIWWWGWLAGYSAATAGQGAVYFLSEDIRTKQDMALGAATTVLGVAGQLITPLNTGRMAELLSDYPESTPEERLKKLSAAEKFLEKAAATEKFGRSWKNHALYGAVSITSGLITWLGFKRTLWDGIANFALNTVVSEVQIWTQPTRSLKNYQYYCNRYKPVGVANRTRPEFFVGACPGGIALRMVF
ncbi:MAG: hypothetical protein V2A67_05920 [Bacteroidota bacterium]